jgi:hypothetical protein
MRFASLPILALLAACGGSEDPPAAQANSAQELENRLDKLADRTEEEIEKPRRLAYLRVGDITPELKATPSCRLHQGGKLVLVVNATGGVARIDGRRVPLTVSGPVGPTGGFLTAPGVTLSVGRTAPFAADADVYVSGWTATATLGGDEAKKIEKLEATWICTR